MAQAGTRATDSPRTSKGIEREQQILAIAENLFHKRGYAQTSVGDIAEATGLLKGSLYYYMESKEDLLYRIVSEVHEVSHQQLADALKDTGTPALERLVDFTHAQLLYNAEHHTRVAVYHHEWRRLEGARLKDVRSRRQEYDQELASLIAQVRDEGCLTADVDLRLVANNILAVVCWPYTWYRPADLTPRALADFGAAFVRSALSGLSAT